jgi:DGQHR domain-containing protein
MPEFNIPCFLYRQRTNENAPRFAFFVGKAAEILKWAGMRRRHQDPQGSQRRLSRAKVMAISNFLRTDDRNTIPPAVTVTLDIGEDNIECLKEISDDVQFCNLKLTVEENTPEEQKPGLVIDGQHRLYGMQEFDENFKVNVVALLTNDQMETAFQFLVINNKVTRVPPDHLRTLVIDYQEDELGKRLEAARLTLDPNLKYVGIVQIDELSPFKDNLALVSHEGEDSQRFIQPSAIENAIDVILRERVPELEREDELLNFFYSIWRPIKDQWPDLWASQSKLMYKVSIVAMTSHMTEGLIARYELVLGQEIALRRS